MGQDIHAVVTIIIMEIVTIGQMFTSTITMMVEAEIITADNEAENLIHFLTLKPVCTCEPAFLFPYFKSLLCGIFKW